MADHYGKERQKALDDWADRQELKIAKENKPKPKPNKKGEIIFLISVVFIVGSLIILLGE